MNFSCSRVRTGGRCVGVLAPAISVLLAGFATAHAGEVFYQACGELVNTGGVPPCLIHVADDGQIVRPFNVGEFKAGDRVVVSGTISQFSASICDQTITPNLAGNTIDRCFAECGTLVSVGGCLRFDSDRGGTFAVASVEEFNDGDRVFVHGPGLDGVADCGGELLPNIAFPVVSDCTSATGRIVSPFGCAYLLTGDGAAYDFFTFAGFQAGDYVTIEGDASLGFFGACGKPYVDRNTIRPAFGGAGTLVETLDCGLVFRADGSAFGDEYRLDNVGGFTAGDRVVVTGRIDDACSPSGACARRCLIGNTIGALTTACGSFGLSDTDCLAFTPDDGGDPFLIEYAQQVPAGAPVFVAGTFRPGPGICENGTNLPVMRDNLFLECVDLCGEFQPGFECTPLFLGDDGNIYWVDNLGSYGPGDRARVRGGREFGCNALCPFTCIRLNEIGPCDEIPGDVNGDGDVDQDDVSLFVRVLLGLDVDPYRVLVSDVNLDGAPDGDDIQPFTSIVLGQQ